uniref:Poly(A)specific ribonuclease PARNlike protein putati n=1 Tax=Albugo laibachii Nc14 TaxID=890382 RepID=F0WXS7_9STRA|nr:Poly(A)specific ribonuclease PARNlike protein putati [Albugo laibachii Nc14]|eukprot:CCA26275.1 Poly(A)specific ribonuclease PARNlike protein putati [Albugo laibachii Nc14]
MLFVVLCQQRNTVSKASFRLFKVKFVHRSHTQNTEKNINTTSHPSFAMNVTRHNFETSFQQVKKSILSDSCKFIAIDTEFTGLCFKEASKEWYLDTLEERYQKLKQTGENFLVSQFGLATVHVTPSAVNVKQENETTSNRASDHKYEFEIKVWNFYLFPRPYGHLDRRFSCQASCLQFLAEHDFDFNKFIYDGISFCKLSKVSMMQKRLEKQVEQYRQQQEDGCKPSVLQLDVQGKKFQQHVREMVDDFLKEETLIEGVDVQQQESKELFLEAKTSYQRMIIYQTIRAIDTNLHAKSVDEGIQIRLVTSEEKKQLMEEKLEQMRSETNEAIGFSRVIQVLKDSNKPIVGHNALLDFIYIYHQFCQPLPNDLKEFKKELTHSFPKIYDTKYMATHSALNDELESSSLSSLFEFMKGRIDLPPSTLISSHENFRRYHVALQSESSDEEEMDQPSKPSPLCHEAGFDAFMTAYCFLGLLHHDLKTGEANGIEIPTNRANPSRATRSRGTHKRRRKKSIVNYNDVIAAFDARFDHIVDWKNHLNLMISDESHLDLKNAKQVIDRTHVYHVHSTKRKIQQLDMEKLFRPSKVRIKRVIRESDQNAFVVLSKEQIPAKDSEPNSSADTILVDEDLVLDAECDMESGSEPSEEEMKGVTITSYYDFIQEKEKPLVAQKERIATVSSEDTKEVKEANESESKQRILQENDAASLWNRCVIS